jgi:hypothetical protein
MEEGGSDDVLIQSTTHAFTWRNWQKPRIIARYSVTWLRLRTCVPEYRKLSIS